MLRPHQARCYRIDGIPKLLQIVVAKRLLISLYRGMVEVLECLGLFYGMTTNDYRIERYLPFNIKPIAMLNSV